MLTEQIVSHAVKLAVKQQRVIRVFQTPSARVLVMQKSPTPMFSKDI